MKPSRRSHRHDCPGCGIPGMPPEMLACVMCWRRLPDEYRRLVNATYRTRNLFPRDHLQAVLDSIRWYRENPPRGRATNSDEAR